MYPLGVNFEQYKEGAQPAPLTSDRRGESHQTQRPQRPTRNSISHRHRQGFLYSYDLRGGPLALNRTWALLSFGFWYVNFRYNHPFR